MDSLRHLRQKRITPSRDLGTRKRLRREKVKKTKIKPFCYNHNIQSVSASFIAPNVQRFLAIDRHATFGLIFAVISASNRMRSGYEINFTVDWHRSPDFWQVLVLVIRFQIFSIFSSWSLFVHVKLANPPTFRYEFHLRPLPFVLLFQNESSGKNFHSKTSLICVKMNL